MRRLVVVALFSALLAACGSSKTATVVKTVTGASTPAATGSSTAAPATTPSTGGAGQPVFFVGAAGDPKERPGTLLLSADGTLEVDGVQWTSWGDAEATGTGNASYHGCTPNCATAPRHQGLVSIRLSAIRTCAGRRYYSGVTLTLNSGRQLDQQFLQRSWSPC